MRSGVTRPGGAGRALLVCVALASPSTACLDRPAAPVTPKLQSDVALDLVNDTIDKVDIVFMVDNSNSMAANQTQLVSQFNILINKLVNPDTDCNGDHVPDFPPVHDMHVAVVDSDLGAPGANVPSCVANADVGDDGLLNPIHYGLAMRAHNPTTTS